MKYLKKELPMKQDVKIRITIEIENIQKKTAESVIRSNHFEQRMMEILKKMGEMAGEAVLDSDTEGISQETRNCWVREARCNDGMRRSKGHAAGI